MSLINMLQQQSDELCDKVGLYSEELGGVIVVVDFGCDVGIPKRKYERDVSLLGSDFLFQGQCQHRSSVLLFVEGGDVLP